MALSPNSIEAKAEAFLKRLETIHDAMDFARGKLKEELAERSEDLREIYLEAADKGVPQKSLKALVKKRRMLKKAEELGNNLTIDERAIYETLCDALGDLGKAAAEKAGFGDANG